MNHVATSQDGVASLDRALTILAAFQPGDDQLSLADLAKRTAFYKKQGLDPLPASTGIQAHLCRPELLIEIEAIAMFRTDKKADGSKE